MRPPLHLRVTPRALAAFAALTLLCGTSHEFVHHFAGAAACGAFGTKTFNSFELAPGCEASPWRLWPTVAGPAFTFALMWWGAWRLRAADEGARRLGLALVFANFPVNRMVFALAGANDEQWVARQLAGPSRAAFWLTAALVWAACLPPLVAAWRAIGNRRRALWFAGAFVLPFAFVLAAAGGLLEEVLLRRHRVLADAVLGVPLLVVLVEVLALAAYVAWRGELAAPAGAAGDRPTRHAARGAPDAGRLTQGG
jgi:hypothetical protein